MEDVQTVTFCNVKVLMMAPLIVHPAAPLNAGLRSVDQAGLRRMDCTYGITLVRHIVNDLGQHEVQHCVNRALLSHFAPPCLRVHVHPLDWIGQAGN